MRRIAVVVWILASGCELPAGADGGAGRTVTLRPLDAVMTSRGLAFDPQRRSIPTWWADSGQRSPRSRLAQEGISLFEVPQGPALFEYEPGLFVYTASSHLEPCGLNILGGRSHGDAGVEVDVTLSEPAGEGDALWVMSSVLPWMPATVMAPDAGSTRVTYRAAWNGKPVLSGNTTVLHSARQPDYLGWERTTTVGILDAGIVDQYGDVTVDLRGTFTSLAATEVALNWDDASLDALQSSPGIGRLSSTSFDAQYLGLPLATASTRSRLGGMVPLVIPSALQPETFLVQGGIQFAGSGGFAPISFFGWREPWKERPELKLKHAPPANVGISVDGSKVTWGPPMLAPGVYLVSLFKFTPPRGLERLALIVTDQTELPIPPELRVPNLAAEVVAQYGEGLTASSCVFQYDRLASWARMPAFSPLWNPP